MAASDSMTVPMGRYEQQAVSLRSCHLAKSTTFPPLVVIGNPLVYAGLAGFFSVPQPL
jgi:hypothetical protein